MDDPLPVAPTLGAAPPRADARYEAATPAAARGLGAEEVRVRRQRYGPNEIGHAGARGPWRELVASAASPLILVLLAASIVAAIVGEVADAAIIAGMVLLSLGLNAVQSSRSNRAAERLRRTVAPLATVLRDGRWIELARRELVPGDVIRLAAGDLVPADARLLQSRDLHAQQAALTGESLPAEKEAPVGATAGGAALEPAGDADPAARDRVFLGTSVVSGTAIAVVTATGPRTAFGDIAARLAERPPETEFERGLRQFGLLITRTVFVLVCLLILVGVVLHRDPLESLLFAVALAVGLVPEFLPMITSVTLANGAVRMARQKVVVRHLAAIENFGSIDILCSDKTGTLTRGEMQLERAVDASDRPSTHVLELAHLNAHFETGIRSPLDDAIDRAWEGDARGWEKVDELPFDFERRRLSVVVSRGAERLLVTKGAPEAVLACCTGAEDGAAVRPLDAAAHACLTTLLRRLGSDGLRVLAVASRPLAPALAHTTADERELVLAGFLAFSDPPLDDAGTALAALRDDGVEVKVLTGDDELVARHVCERTGVSCERIVTGAEIDALSEGALARLAERTGVFARVSPAQKHRILLALRSRGHVVGYLGDGINDAPSLHAADVGISVASAVDVARDAADVVLLERGLGVLHTGIREGRKAFGNVMKYLLMGTSSNFGNMFSMAAASLVLPFLPMLPTQILLNNFLYDLAQVTLPTDRVEEAYVRKPHQWNVRALRDFMLRIGPISSLFDFLTFAVLLLAFRAPERLFHTGWFVESLVTQVLVLVVIRTAGNPLRSPMSRPLAASIAAVVITGVALPFTPVAADLGFVALPAGFLAYLVGATALYLVLVQLAKRRVIGRVLG